MRPKAKVTIDSYIKSIGTKMNDLCLEVVSRSCQPLRYIEEVRSAILATAWLLVMFTDAGAHFIYNIHKTCRQLRQTS